jgi:hypothetical protein
MLSVLATDRSLLADVNSRIADLERSLSELRNERVIVQGRLDAYKYPVLTLPNEIVSEIFVHFIPVYPRPPRLTGTHSPTYLTRICRKWRDIALATPSLWRAIGLIQPERISYKQQNQIFEAWIKRSGACHLAINIEYFGGYSFSLEEIPAVVSQRPRWEHLKMDVHPHALAVINGPMPQLRHLDILFCGYYLSIPFEFQDVPLLRRATLRGLMASKAVILPWEQLTYLELHKVDGTRCVAILQQTTMLVHCVLELFTLGLVVSYPVLITLPCLESLVVKARPGLNLGAEPESGGFLRSFIVPALRSLELDEKFLGLGSDPIASLESFISQSGCRLQRVRIRGRRMKRTLRKSRVHAFLHIPDFSFTRSRARVSSDDESSESSSDDFTSGSDSASSSESSDSPDSDSESDTSSSDSD